jgi:hypothetical protein
MSSCFYDLYRKYCLILFVKQDTFARAICEIVSEISPTDKGMLNTSMIVIAK